MSEKEVCDICDMVVSDDDEGLLCERCLNWKHRACLAMGKKVYQKLSKSSDPWHCDDCRNINANVNSTKKKRKDYTIADVMAKLDDMDKKYNSLFLKYNEQVKVNEELKSELKLIKKQLNNNEQKELNCNITIHGVPYEEREKLHEIVKKIGNQLQVPVEEENFSAVRLGRGHQKNGPIRVHFRNEETKKTFLASKLKISLNSQILGYAANNKIYLNHDLTKRNLEVFKAAQEYKKQNGYKYLWISSGKILLRKDEKSKVTLVEDEKDLKN